MKNLKSYIDEVITINRERLSKIQDILNEMVDTSYVAGVNCLVLEKGKEVGYFEAGYADIKAKKPFKRDTICLLYSMTKPITATATMILMESGKIDLLDPVEKFIPSFKGQMVVEGKQLVPCQRPVTIKDLLSMTSGILYGNNTEVTGLRMDALFEEVKANLTSPSAYSTYEIAQRIGQVPLAFKPGTHWAYGASADVLGAVIEVVAGQSFGAFLSEHIFEPLEMEDTDFWVPEKKRERLAKVYMTREVNQTKVGQTKEKEAIQENSKVEQRKSKLEREYLEEYNGNNLGILISMDQKPHFESGGAGLVSTIDDYSRFAQMLMNKGRFKNTCILASKTVEYMTTCQLKADLNADVAMWDSLRGHSYGNLMRIMTHPELAVFNGSKGEYGWDGWLGPYMANDPTNEITFLMMQQKTDTGTTSYTRKLRNIVSASIE